MALMSAQRLSSFKPSSSETPPRCYDVFLSFRGADVRDNFLEYLYRALRQKGILTFKDDDKLEDGENIKDGLLEAIEESRFSIAVLSKNYADSSWCLNELVRILECKRNNGQVIYPVFYHVEPSEVRNQKGAFGEGFARVFSKKEEKASLRKVDVEAEVKRWTEALVEVGSLKGWVYPDAKFENEAQLIDQLVGKIFNKSINTYQFPDEDLVGIRSRMMQVINLLDLGSDETRVVGLWGMGGIGKTTLAKAVYNSISWQFEGCSFVDRVSEVLSNGGVLALQEHLISDILGEENFRVRSAMRGISIIQNRVCRKKVLIVLDNVITSKQVEDLVGELQWFGRGSRIIITTRDEHVIRVCRAQVIFNVQELDKFEAIQLFKSKAFAENGEIGEFQTLIGRALQYAKGVPLALKVLGSTLLGGTVSEWGSLLDRLEDSLDDKLQEILRISYERLHWKDKEIFLDICCMFEGKNKYQVIKILDSCGFNAVAGITALVKQSLLTISKGNTLCLHDLIQKMGWSIVDEESRKEPGKRSRLWRPYDIKHVLMENTELPKLSVLDLTNSTSLTKSPEFTGFPNLEDLVLEGCTALVDLHPSIGKLKKLKKLIFKDCNSLLTLPHGIQSQCLEILTFSGCSKLNNILENFGDLKRLLWLYLDGTDITELPQSIGNSTNLIYLDCSCCIKLESMPSCIGQLKKLERLYVSYSGVRQLPASVVRLSNLKELGFNGCIETSASTSHISNSIPLELPSFSGFESLTGLQLVGSRLTSVPESVCLRVSLKHLHLFHSDFESLPASIKDLGNLEWLFLVDCKSLQELPELPPNVVTVLVWECDSLKTICNLTIYRDATTLAFSGCPKLVGNEETNALFGYKFVSDQIKKENNHRLCRRYASPGSKIPKWFSYQNVGASVTFHMPTLDLNTSNVLGFAISAVVGTNDPDRVIDVNIKIRGKILNLGDYPSYSEIVFIIYYPIELFTANELIQMSGTVLEVYFVSHKGPSNRGCYATYKALKPAREVKECGAHVFYEDEQNEPLRLME